MYSRLICAKCKGVVSGLTNGLCRACYRLTSEVDEINIEVPLITDSGRVIADMGFEDCDLVVLAADYGGIWRVGKAHFIDGVTKEIIEDFIKENPRSKTVVAFPLGSPKVLWKK